MTPADRITPVYVDAFSGMMPGMRHPGRIFDLVRVMRMRIRDGTWQPGTLLPIRRQLAADSGTAEATVQEAVGRLVAEGSLETRKRAGTRVAARPPELHRIAIVLPPVSSRHGAGRNLLREAVTLASRTLASRRLAGQPVGPDLEVHDDVDAALRICILGDGLVGVLLFGRTAEIADLVGHGPGVAFIGRPGDVGAGSTATCIMPDNRSLFEVGVTELLARGRRRIAVLATPGILDAAVGRHGAVARILARLAARGAATRPSWLQLVDPLEPRGVAQTVALLLSVRPRPDGLLLLDDHLGAPVRRALGAADVMVAIHTNRPDPTGRGLHIGCTARAMIEAGISALQDARAGIRDPRVVRLPATLVANGGA